jgi:aminoglycoside phosphotransferase (APT) family kinase protein
MRQPREDRALYYRQLRDTIRTSFRPELTSAQAIDAAALVDRILAEFIVEEEAAPSLSEKFGRAFEEVLAPDANGERAAVTPARFHQLRAEAAEAVAAGAESADPEARARARRLVAIEREFLERVDALREVVLTDEAAANEARPANACSITAEQLTEYLRTRYPDSPELTVEQLSVVPGGRSKETILVSLAGTSELPAEVILRKDRPVGLLQTRAADEYEVINAVYRFGGVPVPEPFFAEEGTHDLGEGTFLVMARVAGHKAGEFFPDLAAPTEHRREIGCHIAASLARLHAMPLDRLAKTNLDVSDSAVSEEAILAGVEGIVARIAGLGGPPCATVPLARAWLIEHVSDVVPAPRLCLLQGDFGFHNMLVEGDHVTALVDWEAAAIGPAARELAAAWSAATLLMDWPDFVAAYVQAGGNEADADPRAISYYRVLSALGGFMASRMGGDLFRTGAKRDLLTAHSGLDSHFRCTRNLARALDDAMHASGSDV